MNFDIVIHNPFSPALLIIVIIAGLVLIAGIVLEVRFNSQTHGFFAAIAAIVGFAVVGIGLQLISSADSNARLDRVEQALVAKGYRHVEVTYNYDLTASKDGKYVSGLVDDRGNGHYRVYLDK